MKLQEMALECGFDISKFDDDGIIVGHSNGSWVDVTERLAHFANLVAAKEREACAVAGFYALFPHEPESAVVVRDVIRARGASTDCDK